MIQVNKKGQGIIPWPLHLQTGPYSQLKDISEP
jgi:hypothetical protein